MLDSTDTQSIAELLNGLEDRQFRARAVHEYKTIARYTGSACLDGKRILDFGCGQGIAAASFAMRHPSATVFGTDIQTVAPQNLAGQIKSLLGLPYPGNLDLRLTSPSSLPDDINNLDLIYSWSVFEHVRWDLVVPILRLLRSRLKPGGKLFLQIDPLYFSPRGAHLYGPIPEPWSHLIYQTDVLHEKLMSSSIPETSKHRLWDQYRTLNRATARDIVDACAVAGFRIDKQDTIISEIQPPESLLRAYSREALTTSEIRLLLSA